MDRAMENVMGEEHIGREGGGIIICGYGTVGKSASDHLLEKGVSHTIIDKQQLSIRTTDPVRIHMVEGDAAREEILKKAGVEAASALIAATNTDAVNAMIVLLAKTLNPDIRALAVVKKEGSIEKLYKAGADYVVSDAMLGGRLLAKNTVSPYIGDFIDRLTIARNVEITEVLVPSNSPLVGSPLKDTGIRERTGTSVIALKRGEETILSPGGDMVIKGKDRLVVMGSTQGIKNLTRYLRTGEGGGG